VRVLPRSAACHSGTAAPSITVNPLPEHAEPSYRRSVEASVDAPFPTDGLGRMTSVPRAA
jgi:hypothetical protein